MKAERRFLSLCPDTMSLSQKVRANEKGIIIPVLDILWLGKNDINTRLTAVRMDRQNIS